MSNKETKPVEPTVYEKRITAMKLAISSQRGAPHYTTLVKVADEIYKWINDENYKIKTS